MFSCSAAATKKVPARFGGGRPEGEEAGLLPRAHALRTPNGQHVVQGHVRDGHLAALLLHVAG